VRGAKVWILLITLANDRKDRSEGVSITRADARLIRLLKGYKKWEREWADSSESDDTEERDGKFQKTGMG